MKAIVLILTLLTGSFLCYSQIEKSVIIEKNAYRAVHL
jgi:hypothetical protein